MLFFYLPLSINTNENADLTFTFIYNNNNNNKELDSSPSIIDISYSLKCSKPFEFDTLFHWHEKKLYLQVFF